MKFLNAMRLMMHNGTMYNHFVPRCWQILLIVFDYDPDDLYHRIKTFAVRISKQQSLVFLHRCQGGLMCPFTSLAAQVMKIGVVKMNIVTLLRRRTTKGDLCCDGDRCHMRGWEWEEL